MKNYDEIENFIDYTDREYWRKYIEDFVIPLWENTILIIGYFDQLKFEFNNIPLNDVIEDYKKSLLLGGINPDIEELYTQNSLAKFYSRFFGLRLKDQKSWISQQRFGESLTDINIEVIETEFIKFVKEISGILDDGLRYQNLIEFPPEGIINYDEFNKDPIKVKDLISDFYQNLLKISLIQNYGTFFICSINQITYKWMQAAYPRIDKIIDFLQEQFELIELQWRNPIKPESKVFKEYTFYCFPEYNPKNTGKSFGGAICKLNEYFLLSHSEELKNTLNIIFGNIPDFRQEYNGRIKSQLPDHWNKSIYYKGLMASYYRGGIDESNETVMEMLDENMPFLFTHLIKIDYLDDDHMSFMEI